MSEWQKWQTLIRTNKRQLRQDELVDQNSKRRRKLIAPFAARYLSITSVRGRYLAPSAIVLGITDTLGIPVSVRTVQNYLSLSTKDEAYLIPRSFKARLRAARQLPKCKDYAPLDSLEARLTLLDDMQRDCLTDYEYEPVLNAVLDEIELLRRENLLRFDVQKPRRISPTQPVASEAIRHSTNLSDSPHFDFRDELAYGMGQRVGTEDEEDPDCIPTLVSLRDYGGKVFDPYNLDYAGWWWRFSALRTDSIPDFVRRICKKDTGRRPRLWIDEDGRPHVPHEFTMRELILWQKEMREYRDSLAPLTTESLFAAFDLKGRESAQAFYDRLKARLPADITSFRTFERRVAERNSKQP